MFGYKNIPDNKNFKYRNMRVYIVCHYFYNSQNIFFVIIMALKEHRSYMRTIFYLCSLVDDVNIGRMEISKEFFCFFFNVFDFKENWMFFLLLEGVE